MRNLLVRDIFNPSFKSLFPFENEDLGLSYWSKNDTGDYSLSLDIPGVKKEDIKLSINKGLLTVVGERKTKTSSYTYKSTYSVPDDVDTEKLVAEYENGVLTLTAKQIESKKEKLIPIK